jgi:hypothetical protein
MLTGFGGEKLKERHHLDDLSVDREDNIRIDVKDIGWKGLDWIHLPLNVDKLWDFVNTVRNLWVQ